MLGIGTVISLVPYLGKVKDLLTKKVGLWVGLILVVIILGLGAKVILLELDNSRKSTTIAENALTISNKDSEIKDYKKSVSDLKIAVADQKKAFDDLKLISDKEISDYKLRLTEADKTIKDRDARIKELDDKFKLTDTSCEGSMKWLRLRAMHSSQW